MAGEKVAFLGLGVMGFPMAGHLAKAGYAVTVYNRTAAKSAAWVSKHGGASAPTPAAAAKGAAIVFACVGNDDDLRAITLGPDGAFSGMAKGAIFVDHTTASADIAHARAALLIEHFAEAAADMRRAINEGGHHQALPCGARKQRQIGPETRAEAKPGLG